MKKLDVPFSEKDEAKALGARWNPEIRSWTIQDDQDPGPFARWLPKAPDFNVRADTYSVVRGHDRCWSCGQVTDVFGLQVDSGSEDVDDHVESVDGCMLSNVQHVSGDLEERLVSMTDGKLRRDHSKTVGFSYLMNHCRHCDAKIGDFGLHQEPGGPFYEQHGLHVLETIFEDIEAEASVSMPAAV